MHYITDNTAKHKNLCANIMQHIPNIILMGYGGSLAYGTNIDTSDIDIRGVYMNDPDEIIGCKSHTETKTLSEEDVTLYSFKKIIELLSECNPNTIEILGLRPQDYLLISDYGQKLIDNKYAFLSKKAIGRFGGYAKAQLHNLINAKKSTSNENIQYSMNKAIDSFNARYAKYADTKSLIHIDNNNNELVINAKISNLPVEMIASILNELNSIKKEYGKSIRNVKAEIHHKTNKHMMHLIRLYMMGIDLLEKHEIITYRTDDHDLLMSIRNSEFLESDGVTPTAEFEKLLDEYSSRFERAAQTTTLPDRPDYTVINRLMHDIHMDYLCERGD